MSIREQVLDAIAQLEDTQLPPVLLYVRALVASESWDSLRTAGLDDEPYSDRERLEDLDLIKRLDRAQLLSTEELSHELDR